MLNFIFCAVTEFGLCYEENVRRILAMLSKLFAFIAYWVYTYLTLGLYLSDIMYLGSAQIAISKLLCENGYPTNIYLFKVNNSNNDIEVNFEHISHLFLVFLVLTLNK